MALFDTIGGALSGGIAGGISGIVGNIFGGLGDALGISEASRQKELESQQKKELMDYQYRLNERGAENAYKRQMELYERSLRDNSPEARRKRLEDAGLSVGLMMGNGAGQIGSGSGSTTTPPQANTAQASGALSIGRITPIEMATLQKNQAEINLMNSEARKNNADAAREEGSKNYHIEMLRQEGIAQWMANELKSYWLENNKEDMEEFPEFYQEWKNERLEETVQFKPDNTENREKLTEILLNATRAEAEAGDANMKNAEALLSNEKTRWYFTEMLIKMAMGRAAEAQALAAKTAADANALKIAYDTGEEWNWKTVADYGFRAAGMAIDAWAAGSKAGMAGKWLEQADRHWQGEMEQRMDEAAKRQSRWEMEETRRQNPKRTVYRDAKDRKTGSKTTF